jgi:hypothetical protein
LLHFIVKSKNENENKTWFYSGSFIVCHHGWLICTKDEEA